MTEELAFCKGCGIVHEVHSLSLRVCTNCLEIERVHGTFSDAAAKAIKKVQGE